MRTTERVWKSAAAGALVLRRLPWLHRGLKWVKDVLCRAIWEAILEFSRWVWADCEWFGPPKRTFSVYQALRTGSPPTRGRILVHEQGCPVVREDSMLVSGGYNQHKEQPWPIFWSQHANAHLVTESLALMEPGKQVCIESVSGLARLRSDPAYRFFRLPRPVRLPGNWTSIVSRWVPATHKEGGFPIYTQWVLDALPRLALISEFPPDTRIIVPERLHPNEMESLAMLGLLDRCRPAPERHLEVENYYFSSLTAMLQGYNPYGINFLRQSFLPKRDRGFAGPKRVFIRRLGLSREPQNRAALEQMFQDMGWTLVNPMEMSLAQQIQLFHGAEAITGMFGSGFTNCVFCQPHCIVIPIMPREFGLDGYLDWISQIVGFRWQPIVISANYTYRFSVDLDLIRDRIASMGLV